MGKPYMAALRVGDYKIIWGSRTTKDTWYKPNDVPLNRFVCNQIKKSRTQSNRSRILIPRGVETMEVLKLNVSEDQEYEDDYENIEKIQAEELVQIGDIEDVDDKTMSVLSMLDEK